MFSARIVRTFLTFRTFPLAAVALACASWSGASRAADTDLAGPADTAAPAVEQLPPVVVTGNPLRLRDAGTAVQRLAGDALVERRASTLGATLDGLPGVRASQFGPQASRPVLRGLDGDRLRVLSNGGAAPDASSLSPDHAVAVDPLVVDAIEVLRGPAALLYGGNALGGVVNLIDKRIPRQPAEGTQATLETRLGGASNTRALAGTVDGGSGAWAWHADASRRLDDLQKSPLFSAEGVDSRRVRNSDGNARSAAVGGGYVGESGHAGLSYDDTRSFYGTPAEEGVRIDLQRQRWAHDGEWRWSEGWLRSLSWQASHTRYQHDELEPDGSLGTRFQLRGNDLRLQAEHAPLPLAGSQLRGVVGLQAESQDFAALGEEAFVPSTRTRQQALFLFEQWQRGDWQLSGGLRQDRIRVGSDGDANGAEEARFGAAQERRFSPRSAALQLAWQLAPAWRLQAQASHSERAPTYYELYANGLHVATAAFERGDATLPSERSRAGELALVYAAEGTRLQAQLWQQRFSRYIGLRGTGETVPGEDGETLPVYAFRLGQARLRGTELQLQQRLAPGWQLEAQAEWTQGEDPQTGEPLPRMPPRRLKAGLRWSPSADWSWRLDATQVAAQTRVASDDQPTPGYTTVDLGLTWRFALAGQPALWTLQARNLGDRLAYNATTVATVRDLAPLPGRSLFTSLRLAF